MVIQSVRPYVSSEDIDKGTRWSSDIANELAESTFGILCITKENLDAPWINFEAGALSKTIDKSLVAPFLFDIKRSEVKGPLLQFQSTINEREDIKKLLISINNRQKEEERLEDQSLQKTLEVWWPQLENSLNSINDHREDQKTLNKQNHKEEILEELLELARNQQKLLRSPQELLPPDYVRHLLRIHDHPSGIHEEITEMAMFQLERLIAKADQLALPEEEGVMLINGLKEVRGLLRDTLRIRRPIRVRSSPSST